MDTQSITLILHVEDSPTDALLTRLEIDQHPQFQMTQVSRLEDALQVISTGHFAVALLDLGLPDSMGLDTLIRFHREAPQIPVVVMTGTDDDQLALRAIQEGAQDYLVKGGSREIVLVRTIRYAIERHVMNQKLSEREELFRGAFEHTNLAMVLTDLEHRFVRVNPAFAELFGYSVTEMLRLSMPEITHPDDLTASFDGRKPLISGSTRYFQMEKRYFHKNGQIIWGLTNVSMVLDANGRPFRYVGQVQDITERKRAEEALEERTALALVSAEIGEAFTRSASLRNMLQRCVASIVNNLNVAFARVWTFNELKQILELQASAGIYTHIDGPYREVPLGEHHVGRIAKKASPELISDFTSDPSTADLDCAPGDGIISFAGYPLLIENRLVGVLAVFARTNLSVTTFQSMETVANQIALGIESNWKEAALKKSEERFRELTAHLHQVLWMFDARENKVLYVSPRYETMWGRSCQSLIDNPESYMEGIHPLDMDMMRRENEVMVQTGRIDVKCRVQRPDDSVVWVWIRGYPVVNEGQIVRLVGIIEDITERMNLEKQFQQSQKMEAVGQLAGGIAHDFNNLLTVINSYSEMILADECCFESSQIRKFAESIGHAGKRAASLTRQLLAFSRKQLLEAKELDLNHIVSETSKMLGRLIDENIDLNTVLDPKLRLVKADPGQIEQVIMNLVINARDAMPQGGKLTIETANTSLDETYTRAHPELRPGQYVMLTVADTGTGMDHATKLHMFEPFFTTKEQGKGTGLGLATVFGIVKQSEGHVSVYSELGSGSTFKVYLPAIKNAVHHVQVPNTPVHASNGSETILVAEDEPVLIALTRHILTSRGYTVLEASNGQEALRIAEEYEGTIHMLVTDVVMPGMSGRQLVEQLAILKPDIKVLYVSGYTNDAVVRHGVLQAETAFLQKPFTPVSLALKVREVLDLTNNTMLDKPA